MSPFDDVIKELKHVNTKSQLTDLYKTEIRRKADDIVDLVSNRWLRGVGVDGGIIGTYKSRDYELFKSSLNPLADGYVDLINTGALKDGLFLGEKSNLFIIKSTDYKYKMIADKYGIEQFGITYQENEDLLNTISNLVFEFIINKVYGK